MSDKQTAPYDYGFWQLMDDAEQVFLQARATGLDLSSACFSLSLVQEIPPDNSSSGHHEKYYSIIWWAKPGQTIAPEIQQFLLDSMPVRPALGDVPDPDTKFPLALRHITLRLASQPQPQP